MLVMVAHGRGVAALPRWLAEEYASRFELYPLKLGKKGIAKQIFLGRRETDEEIRYLVDFIEFAASLDSEI
jgi:LysR family transcriptional regulator for metE and metH